MVSMRKMFYAICDKQRPRSVCALSFRSIVQIIFHFLSDHWAHCGIFENGVLLINTLESVSSVANFITAYEESQYYRDTHFLMCAVLFVSKGNLFDVYLNSLARTYRKFVLCKF